MVSNSPDRQSSVSLLRDVWSCSGHKRSFKTHQKGPPAIARHQRPWPGMNPAPSAVDKLYIGLKILLDSVVTTGITVRFTATDHASLFSCPLREIGGRCLVWWPYYLLSQEKGRQRVTAIIAPHCSYAVLTVSTGGFRTSKLQLY